MEIKLREADVLSRIKTLLTFLERFDVLSFTRIHVSAVPRSTAGGRICYSPNKDMAGFSDLEVVARGRDGRALIAYIEVKSPTGGELSEKQKGFKDRRTRHGALFCVARSLQDAKKFLKEEMGLEHELLR